MVLVHLRCCCLCYSCEMKIILYFEQLQSFFSFCTALPSCSSLNWEPIFWELALDLSSIIKLKISVTRKLRETGSFFISSAKTWIPFSTRNFWIIFMPRWSRITMAFCSVYTSLFFRNKAFVECDIFGIIGPFENTNAILIKPHNWNNVLFLVFILTNFEFN